MRILLSSKPCRPSRKVHISSFAARKNTGLCKLLAQTLCGMMTKWELCFRFLYILQQVKYGRESHFVEPVLWAGPLRVQMRLWNICICSSFALGSRLTLSSSSYFIYISYYHSLLCPVCVLSSFSTKVVTVFFVLFVFF